MNPISWPRLRWAPRLFALPAPEPAEQAARILSVQRNIVLPVRIVLMLVVFYYLFYLRWLNQPATSWGSVVLEKLQAYFIFYIVAIAIASILLVLRRFPTFLVQWVVFIVGLLDGLLLAGLTLETGGFGSTLFWVFPGLIILNALSLPPGTPQIVVNLSLSIFYLGAGLLNTGMNGDLMLSPFPETRLKTGSSLLAAGDIKDLPGFLSRLQRPDDPVSQFLWSRLSEGLREAARRQDPVGANDNTPSLHANLVNELNQIISSGSIYDEARFAHVNLSGEAQSLIGQNLRGERLVRLNRLLLEEAYPAEIAKKHRLKSDVMKFMGSMENPSPPTPAEYDTGAEPFLLRLIILWLLTSSCYGVQLLSHRHRQAEQDSREAAARNAELKAAGRLAAEIAHQLKNPLGIINNTIFSLERGLRQGKQDFTQQLDIIREEIERSDRIITQLMGYSQLSEGRVEKLRVTDEIERAITEAFPPAANYTTRIHRDFGPNLPDLVMQRIHLSAVLVNLLQNAREALNGRGNIRISAQAPRENEVEIIVADDGPGISADKLPRIFDPYFTSKARGTGLGLAIVKHNVELYGGTLTVESKLGKGARFILLFPVRTFVK